MKLRLFQRKRKSGSPRRLRISLILASTLIVLLLPILAFRLLRPQESKATWMDDAWTYRSPWSFTHNAALANRRVSFTIANTNTLVSAGKMQSTCNDVRFTDINGKPLLIQLISGCNSASTVYEAVIPSVVSGVNAGYVYYGNPAAKSASQTISSYTSLSPSGGAAAFSTEEKGQGPIANWGFDEGGTTSAHDNSSNGMTGTLTNMASPTNGISGWQSEDKCLVGKCMAFDGTDDYVTVPDASPLDVTTSFTISAWINTRTISGADIAVVNKGRDATATYAYEFGLDTGRFALKLYDGTNNPTVVGTTTASLQTWYYVTGTYDGSTLKIYVNGALENSTSYSINIGNQSGAMVIGKNANASDRYFSGKLDDVRMYNYVLSATQIRTNYQSRGGSDVSASIQGGQDQRSLSGGLVGYWKMDEAASNSCLGGTNDNCDSSGFGADGAWSGTPTISTGKFGNSLDTGGGYITVGSGPTVTGTGVTLAAWINPTSTSARDEIIDLEGFNLMNLQSGKLCFYNGDVNNAYVCSTASISTSTWTHVLATYDPITNTERIYINGNLDSSFTPSGAPSGGSLTTSIGYCNACAANGFTGKIDEVRAYNRSLSAQEARQLYNFAPGPVGYWNMDEASGQTINDASGNASTGTLGSTSSIQSIDPSWTHGKYGSSLNFDGVNDYADIPDAPSIALGKTTDSYTVEAWAYITSSVGTGWILAKGQAFNGDSKISYGFRLNNAKVSFELYDGTNSTAPGGTVAQTLTLKTWHHITGIRDVASDTARIYIDGVLSDTQADTITTTMVSTSDLNFGSNPGSHTELLNGKVDDVKVYNYARSPSQIIEDMNGGHPLGGSPVSSQVAYWPMDETNGTTAHDNTPNANDLTLSAASWTKTGKTNSAWNGTGAVWLTRADDDDFDFAASDDFSLSMWFKSDSASNPSNDEYLYSKGTITNAGTAGYVIYADTAGKVNFGIKDDGAWGASSPNTITPDDVATSTSDIYDNTWHHIVVEKSATTGIYLYVDGRLDASDTSLAATATLANAVAIRVGDDDADSANSFNGDLDEIKVYRAALTSDQIAVDKNAGASVNYGATATSESTQITGTAETPPVGYWPFDERTGSTVTDKSGGGINATITDGGTIGNWSTGKFGNAYYLKGGNGADVDKIDFGGSSISLGTSNTISFWVNFDNINANGATVGTSSQITCGTNCGYMAYFDNAGNIYDRQETGSAVSVSTGTLTMGTWYHFAVVRSGTSITFYMNGTKVGATQTLGANNAFSLYSLSNFYTAGANDYPVDGKLDEVKVYNYARTAAQVAYDYNRGAPIGWWQFDECQGTTAYDASGNGNNATMTFGGGTYTQAGTCTSGTASDAWYGGAVGKFNSGIALDLTTDTIDMGNVSLYSFERTNAFSTSTWLKTSSDSPMTLLAKQNSIAPFNGWSVQTGTGGFIYFQLTNTYSSNILEMKTNNVSYADGNWHNVITTYDGSSSPSGVHVYFDGKDQTLNTDFSSLSATIVNSLPVTIGSANDVYLKYQGNLDDARIYNYALTQSQVNKIFNGGGGVNFSPSTGSP